MGSMLRDTLSETNDNAHDEPGFSESLWARTKTFSLVFNMIDIPLHGWTDDYTQEQVDFRLEETVDRFLSNLDLIAEECSKRGIVFVPATQRSHSVAAKKSEHTPDVRGWAAERGLPLVDAIRRLDADRGSLLTRAHLGEKGNRLLTIERLCAPNESIDAAAMRPFAP